jgi:hypothetical protein
MIEIRGTGVKKTYLYENIQARVLKLVNFYERMEKKRVPNIDHLDCYNKESGSVHLSPKGSQAVPKNQQELLEAIICVLEALVVSMLVIFRWISNGSFGFLLTRCCKQFDTAPFNVSNCLHFVEYLMIQRS